VPPDPSVRMRRGLSIQAAVYLRQYEDRNCDELAISRPATHLLVPRINHLLTGLQRGAAVIERDMTNGGGFAVCSCGLVSPAPPP
jgi:hypothetical protein